MSNKQKIVESAEVTSAKSFQLSKLDVLRSKVTIFALNEIYKFADKQRASINDIQALLEKIKPHQKVKFIKNLVSELDQILSDYAKSQTAVAVSKTAVPKVKELNRSIAAGFISGKIDLVITAGQELNDLINTFDTSIDPVNVAKQTIRWNYTPSNGSIFTAVADTNIEDYFKDINQIDWSKPVYGKMQFPDSTDLKLIAYFLKNLSNEPSITRLSQDEYRMHNKAANANSEVFKQLIDLFKQYQTYNNKDVITKIVSLVKQVPGLEKTMRKFAKRSPVVYRGIDAGDLSETQIRAIEAKNRFVATSPSESVARQFAYQRGHMEDEDTIRSERPCIITYAVSPESFMFDTRLVNIAYGETEIVIDTSKATILRIDFI